MRFSFIFTAALVTIVNAGEEPFLRGSESADSVILETKDYNDQMIIEELKEYGDPLLDKSCLKQTWKSPSGSTDCATKQDSIGGACVWCSGSKKMEEQMKELFGIKNLDLPKYSEWKKIIDNTGYCATGNQTTILGENGYECDSKISTPKIE